MSVLWCVQRRSKSLPLLSLVGLCAGPCTAGVTFTIDPTQSATPISPYIYGLNPGNTGGAPDAGLNQTAYKDLNLTLERLGGNRWSAYNWTTNASNAGTDYQLSNDNYLDSSKTPGDAMVPTLNDAASRGAATILTVPINGYVSADESGPVPANVLPQNSTHFVPEYPTPAADPSPAANHVYQSQFVQWVKTNYASSLTAGSTHPTMFMLDNEPDIWSSTHPEVHPTAATYAELVQKSVAYATAIKSVAPNAMVLGPASYGWNGYTSLQNATDSAADNAAINPATGKAYGDFLSYYLAQMKAAGATANQRLIDALDVHWYPEATGANASGVQTRIINADNSPGVVAARLLAPHSLWDPNYVENSWITQDSTGGKAIQLLPKLQGEIATNYAGTKLSMSEYNYGGGNDVSGAVAEADVLGLLGKYGVYSAAEWPLASNESFIYGAMRMFRNYDGKNGSFGNTSVSAVNSDSSDTSIYASTDTSAAGKLTLVAINESLAPISADIVLKNLTGTYSSFTAYQLTSGSTLSSDGTSVLPTLLGTFPISQLSTYTMPAESVSTLVLTPIPEPSKSGMGLVVGGMAMTFRGTARRRRRLPHCGEMC